MTPTESDKQAALAWAEDVCSNAYSKTSALGYGKTLAAALRQAEAESESWNRQTRVEFELRKKTESRLKTLEEENARMRESLKTCDMVLSDQIDKAGFATNRVALFYRTIEKVRAALKQEAE